MKIIAVLIVSFFLKLKEYRLRLCRYAGMKGLDGKIADIELSLWDTYGYYIWRPIWRFRAKRRYLKHQIDMYRFALPISQIKKWSTPYD